MCKEGENYFVQIYISACVEKVKGRREKKKGYHTHTNYRGGGLRRQCI